MTRSFQLTIGLPVFNGQQHLSQAVESLLNQTYADFHLVLRDNHSTDATESICRELVKHDRRVEYIRNERNEGAIANFNALLDTADSPYFMWAASDDWWERNFLQSTVDLLANNSTSVAFCNLDNIDACGTRIRRYPRLNELTKPRSRLARLNHMLWFPEHEGKANLIYGVMRTKQAQVAGGLIRYSSNAWGIDYLAVFRRASLGSIALVDRCMFHKRVVAPENASSRRRWPATCPEWLWRQAENVLRWIPSAVPGPYLQDYWRVFAELDLSSAELRTLRVSLRMRMLVRSAQARLSAHDLRSSYRMTAGPVP